MPYQIDELNRALRTDAPGFLAECEARYERQVAAAAETALAHRWESPVILLAGPSSSGKTTTACKLARVMEQRGVKAYVISLDDYYRHLPPEATPYMEDGLPDYESPLYLDMPLLNTHFAALSAGEPITIPRFDFTLHRQSDTPGRELRLMPGEMAIFEGIHALGEHCAGRFPQALGIDVRAETDIMSGDSVLLPHLQSRLCRRMVRDALFRDTPPAFTLKMWGVVLRGERLYISPARHRAAFTIDSALPYEAAVLRHRALPELSAAVRDGCRFPDCRSCAARSSGLSLSISPSFRRILSCGNLSAAVNAQITGNPVFNIIYERKPVQCLNVLMIAIPAVPPAPMWTRRT